MSRENNREDVTINGVEYMVMPGDEGYSKEFVRVIVQQQQIGGTKDQLTSRPDIRPMFQTSWAGGSRWEKPLISAESIDVYNISRGFDLFKNPGDLVPLPDIAAIAADTIHDNPFALHVPAVANDIVYYFEAQKASLGIIQWNESAFSALINDFGNNANAIPVSMCWDETLSTVFALFIEPGVFAYVKFITPDSAGGAVVTLTRFNSGANIFIHDGRLLVWDGTLLIEINDPLGTPTETTIFNDGHGGDMLYRFLPRGGITPAINGDFGPRLAVSTTEGVYIIKNILQDGLPTGTIWRVETTNNGQDIGSPIATLARGVVALNITWHLGSLIIAASSDLFNLRTNETATPIETIFYQFNVESGLGTIGSALGPLPDETVYRFLGSESNILYIGGTDRIWVWDAVRGGLHPLLLDRQLAGFGTWGSMVNTTDGTSPVLQFFHDDSPGMRLPLTDTGGATDIHSFDSVYFDGNLPGEQKTVVAVTLMTDGIQANETWTVSLSADDTSFASVAIYDTDNDKTVQKEFASAVVGFRFQYRLAYTASSDVSTPSVIKGIIFWMVAGEMMTQWQFRLDLSSSLNLKNKKVSLDTQWTNLETLGNLDTLVTLIDNYRSPENAQTTHDVRVNRVHQVRSTPSEGFADITLVEHNLNN